MKVNKSITIDRALLDKVNTVRAKLLKAGIEITFSEFVEIAVKYLLGEETELAKKIKEVL